MSNPKIAFGMRLTSVALFAKAGKLLSRHRVELLCDTLSYFRGDDRICDVVLAFNRDSQIDMRAAGQTLFDYLDIYCAPESGYVAANTETTLKYLDAENAGVPIYDWQGRADING